jgi:hypothetical protein
LPTLLAGSVVAEVLVSHAVKLRCCAGAMLLCGWRCSQASAMRADVGHAKRLSHL